MKRCFLLVIILFALNLSIIAQNYTVAGSAFSTSNTCFTLTNSTGQAGAVWNSNMINLNEPLDITLVFNFGDIDPDTWANPPCGADGISFILQPLGTGVSTSGGGAGFTGISPSFGVVMDTYSQNPTDPLGDHISIHQNGDQLHGTGNELVPPSDANNYPYNVEDGEDHSFRFVWTPGGTAEVYFDGVLTFTYSGDIVNDIFGGDPMVYWGASASTGACWNLQTVCLEIEASFSVPQDACANLPVHFTDDSYSGTTINSWSWDFGDGNSSNEQNPVHTYSDAGTYTVELTIQNIAGLISSTTFDVNITQPNVSASASNTSLCSGESTSLYGDGAISYSWTDGISNGVPFVPPMGTTTYFVTGTDNNGCTNTTSIDITVNPPAIPLITGNQSICAGSSSTLDAGNYVSYNWSTDETSQTITVSGGTYIVTVTDINGCTGQDDFTVTEFQSLSPHLESGNVSCFGQNDGWASVDVFGGYEPYFYEWSNGEIGSMIDSLSPGLYWISITDSFGCGTSAEVSIEQATTPLFANTNTTDASCGNYSDGNIDVTATGGTPPYQFVWSNESWQEDQIGIEAGIYTVTVTDANYCDLVLTDTVFQPEPIQIFTLGDQSICPGQICEIGYSMITGGVPPYTVIWTHHGIDGEVIEVAPETTTEYGAFVMDSINCISDTSYMTVHVMDSLRFAVLTENDTVCPNDTLRLYLDAKGAGEIYMNDSLLESTVIQVIPGTDTVFAFTAWDACHFDSIYLEYPIRLQPLPDVLINASITEGCQPLTVHFNEGSPHTGQEYLWFFDDGDVENLSFDKRPVHTFYNAATYHVILRVESPEACINKGTVAITVHPKPVAEFDASRTTVSLYESLIEFTNYSEGGYWYKWNMGDGNTYNLTNVQHQYESIGNYRVELCAISPFNCKDTTSADITVVSDVRIFAPTAFTPNEDNLNESFTVTITGLNYSAFHMEIYNRWGERLFSSNKAGEGWDGSSQNVKSEPGIYLWYVEFEDYFGNKYHESGKFTLLK